MIAVKTGNLGRTYRINDNKKEIVALAGVDLEIAEGEIRGLLGPNGAGKTTLIKILSTLLLPSSGRAFIMGYDVVKETEIVRGLIGIVLGGDRGFYSQLTPRETLEYWAALYRVPIKLTHSRVTGLLEKVGLLGRANFRVETLSRGMKQRLHLALRGKLMELPGVSSVTEIGVTGGNRIELDSSSAITDVMLFLLSSGVTNLRTSRPTLEEVYLHLIR